MLTLWARLMVLRYETVIKCALGVTKEFKVDLGLHQQAAFSCFLLSMHR